jgi:hypothetical protein
MPKVPKSWKAGRKKGETSSHHAGKAEIGIEIWGFQMATEHLRAVG